MEDRLTEIEIKLSYTENLLEELNRTVFRQQQQLELQQAQLRFLYQQMSTASAAEGGEQKTTLRDELPPHY